MKLISEMTQAELGAYIQTHLRELGIDVVLSGGAAVGIYSEGKYVSKDLDFVNRYFIKRSRITFAMEELGFKEVARYYIHTDTEFFVEFPPGPLSFGEEPVSRTNEITYDTGILKLITAVDCVKDRLAWYYHFGDKQCLEQAILVCKTHAVDLDEIRRWSQVEGKSEDFEQIKNKLGVEEE